MDYGQLGPDNAAELGTCARNAYEILRYCRLTGDADTFAAVEPALRFMEQFKVPRAAQVWECPVHAPDILAAADAIEAYLEAYRFSGDRRYLERATGWAWRGLPFLYVWNPPDRPMLRYASIAILGGSWHAGSWIGQPVQWNGLRYAYALLKLAEADSSFPWKPVAEGVTVSALHQQDESDPNAALWPDNFSAIDGSKCAWVFEPGLILKNVFRLLDHEVEPSTTVLGSGTERVFVSSRARISEGAWAPPTLRFQASFPPGESGSVVVGHVTRPATVSVNGVPAASLSSPLQQAAGNAWRHETDSGLLTLRLGSTGPHSVEVAGVRYEPAGLAPPALDRIAFDFATGREGWQAAHEVEDLRAEDGLLKGTATGGDPYLHRLRLRVGGRLSDQVAVRARVSSGEGLALFWITRESPRWGEDKVLRLPLRPGSALEEYVFEAGKHGEWAGRQITGLRLDPLEGPSGGTFEIDSIRLR
jgi:hypothetical protein